MRPTQIRDFKMGLFDFLKKKENEKSLQASASDNVHKASTDRQNDMSMQTAKGLLPLSSKIIPWSQEPETIKWIQAIKKTWHVDCLIFTISESDSNALEAKYPKAKVNYVISGQNIPYVIEISKNSIFTHEYGSYLDFGYVKFLYKNDIYYVNAAPLVQLTHDLYNRMELLCHFAKIMITLNEKIGTDRKTLLIKLEGDITQDTVETKSIADVAKKVDFEYKYNTELDGIEITKYTGSEKEVLIPEIIEGKPVKSIRFCAFENCTELTSVTIPNSVTKIGEAAFTRCTTLTSVKIGESVTSISDLSFSLCKGLTSITIPNSVKSIGEQAFGDCIALTNITIPDNVTKISDTAFYNCMRLTNLTYKGKTYSYNREKYGLPQEFYNAVNGS